MFRGVATPSCERMAARCRRVPLPPLSSGEDVEEVGGNRFLGGIASELEAACRANDLRDVGVCMVAIRVAVRTIKIVLRPMTSGPVHCQ